MLKIFIPMFIIINIVGFFIMKIDKKKAVNHQYRIAESTLWLVAIFFGAIGMTIGMNTFRHKTKHQQFKYGLPIIALVEIALVLYGMNFLS